ncbi:MAG: transposase, partial [Planctomycetes bacterium]|nr:transposase [Planctomycetota bacterium]
MDALDEALRLSKPMIFHSDQGSQYTCSPFIDELKAHRIQISMSGRGRCFDNILAERLWRTVKYEEVYLKEYGDGHELIRSLPQSFEYYNDDRPHMSLDYQTPAEAYHQNRQSLR